MYLMYATHAVSIWYSLFVIFLCRLPGQTNVAGEATALLLFFPILAVCCSAELLIHVTDDDKRTLSDGFATRKLTNQFVVTVGSLSGITSVLITWLTWKLGAYFLESMIAIWVIGILSVVWMILCPVVGLAVILDRARGSPVDS